MYVQKYFKLLIELAESINREDLRRIVFSILKNPLLSISSTQPAVVFEESPAAPRKHHMFSGGLIIHTYSVAKIALTLCDIFSEVYKLSVDRDLVLSAAILHDIYKYYQYIKDDKEGGYRARDDWYLSHDYAIVAELATRGAKDDLIRVVSEVHGVTPIKTYEGLIVHLADSIDARFGEYIQNNIISLLKELEQQGHKPHAVVDESVKIFGVEILGLASKDKDSFLRLIREMLLRR